MITTTELRLHLPVERLQRALQPLRNYGRWADAAAWADLQGPQATSDNPRSWCFANSNRLQREGLSGPDMDLLLGALRLVLAAAYQRANRPQDYAAPQLQDQVHTEASALAGMVQDAITWLQFEADSFGNPERAESTARQALTLALEPFIDPANWERQLTLADDPSDATTGRWVCTAGTEAKLQALAVYELSLIHI